MPRKQTPRKGAAHQPTPSPKKKSATKATPSPKGPPVHANVKTMTRLFRDHIAALRRWTETEDEGRDVLTSLERFTGRIPLLERARWDERARPTRARSRGERRFSRARSSPFVPARRNSARSRGATTGSRRRSYASTRARPSGSPRTSEIRRFRSSAAP